MRCAIMCGVNVWLYLEDGPDSRTLSIPVPANLSGTQPPAEMTFRDVLTDDEIVLRYQRTTIIDR